MRRVIEEGETVSEVIVECVAAETGRDSMELPPFAESIDADALEACFRQSNSDGQRELTVTYEGCEVTVE